MEVFQHTFPATQVRPAYTGPAVRHGLNIHPVITYQGRPCIVTGSQRISRRKVGRTAYNSLSVLFVDDGSLANIPAGQFNKPRAARGQP